MDSFHGCLIIFIFFKNMFLYNEWINPNETKYWATYLLVGYNTATFRIYCAGSLWLIKKSQAAQANKC